MQERHTQQPKPDRNPKVSVCERLVNMTRVIRRTGCAEEAQEAAELEQYLQNRIQKLTGNLNATQN